jgi:hypothetical protein
LNAPSYARADSFSKRSPWPGKGGWKPARQHRRPRHRKEPIARPPQVERRLRPRSDMRVPRREHPEGLQIVRIGSSPRSMRSRCSCSIFTFSRNFSCSYCHSSTQRGLGRGIGLGPSRRSVEDRRPQAFTSHCRDGERARGGAHVTGRGTAGVQARLRRARRHEPSRVPGQA